MRLISSLLYLSFLSIVAILCFPISLLISLFSVFSTRKVLLHKFTTFWSLIYLKALPGCKEIRVSGNSYLDKNKTYIFVSNHQSLLDIMMGFAINFHFKWVSKKEVFKLPFIGWNMFLNHYIGIKRGDKRGIKKMMNECTKHLQNKNSIYMFPEGTRSTTDEIGKFRNGAFTLAKENKVDIVPIKIKNTDKIYDKNGFLLNDITLKIAIYAPITYESFKNKPVQQIAKETRDLFV